MEELSAKDAAMAKLTRLQQDFCLHYLKTNNAAMAYKLAKKGKCSEKTAKSSSSRLRNDPNVKKFLELAMQEAVTEAVMTRKEMLEALTVIARVSMNDLIEWQNVGAREINRETGEPEEVEQSIWTVKESALLNDKVMSAIAELTAGRDGFKIKLHSPLTAMKLLADLAGYNEPTKQEITGTVDTTIYSSEEYKQAILNLDAELRADR